MVSAMTCVVVYAYESRPPLWQLYSPVPSERAHHLCGSYIAQCPARERLATKALVSKQQRRVKDAASRTRHALPFSLALAACTACRKRGSARARESE